MVLTPGAICHRSEASVFVSVEALGKKDVLLQRLAEKARPQVSRAGAASEAGETARSRRPW